MFYSIIVPAYNSALSISDCIQSILNQTFSDFEVLIIDGKSADETLEIAKSFKDKRIQVISQVDNGVYDAMNKGLSLARGKWLYFLGSDDKLANSDVLSRVSVFTQNTTAKVIYGDVQVQGTSGWARNESIYGGLFSIQRLLLNNICHQAIFYNRDFIAHNRLNYNTEYPICADWDFNLKLFSLTQFEYLPIVIANFSAGGLSTRASSIEDSFSNSIVEKFIEYFKITSFQKLKKIIPIGRMYQLRRVKDYYWQVQLFMFQYRIGLFKKAF